MNSEIKLTRGTEIKLSHGVYPEQSIVVDPHLVERYWLDNLVVVVTANPQIRLIGMAHDMDVVEMRSGVMEAFDLQYACNVVVQMALDVHGGKPRVQGGMFVVPFDGAFVLRTMHVIDRVGTYVVGRQSKDARFDQMAQMYANIIAPSPILPPDLMSKG